MAPTAKHPTVGDTVCWKTFLGEWRCGEYLGFANYTDDHGHTYASVRAYNGIVYVAFEDLS